MTELPENNWNDYMPGGLMQCCTKTIEGTIFDEQPQEGDTLDCRWCAATMVYRGGAWCWVGLDNG
jgi:hypothetical protein